MKITLPMATAQTELLNKRQGDKQVDVNQLKL